MLALALFGTPEWVSILIVILIVLAIIYLVRRF